MNASAVAHFISGGLMIAWGLKDLTSTPYISKYRPPKILFLYEHGFTIGALFVGVALLIAGVVSLRGKRPAAPPSGAVYIWDMPPIFGFIAGIPMTLFAAAPLAFLPKAIGDRGFDLGSIFPMFMLLAIFIPLAFLLLHYRRTTILDPASQRLVIAFGKPFVFYRKHHAFSDFSSVATEIAYGKRGAKFYRAMAAGDGKKPELITVTMSEAQGRQNLDESAANTGWTKV